MIFFFAGSKILAEFLRNFCQILIVKPNHSNHTALYKVSKLLVKLSIRFEQFLVEICLKNFVCKIRNPGQIGLKTWKFWKLNKNFKKVGPICGNLSYKSQLTKVWAVLSWNLPKKTSFARFKILAKAVALA